VEAGVFGHAARRARPFDPGTANRSLKIFAREPVWDCATPAHSEIAGVLLFLSDMRDPITIGLSTTFADLVSEPQTKSSRERQLKVDLARFVAYFRNSWSRRNPRPQPKSAFSCFPLVHRANQEDLQRVRNRSN
jgi:hypothetical protein